MSAHRTIPAAAFSAMKAAKRWLICSPDKVPYYIDGTPRRGVLDTPEDRARLGSYIDALAALARCPPGWYLGFALGEDGEGGCWQGIDFDAIEDNLLTMFVDALPGYVETSPSGKGVHAIGYGRRFHTLGSNGSGIEAYAAGRFFTVTGRMIRDGGLVCLADHVENDLAGYHQSLSHKAMSSRASAAKEAGTVALVTALIVTELRSALNSLRADDYGTWIEMGLALKELGDTGRELWLTWSATSEKFDPGESARKWEGFSPTRTGYRTVFKTAQAAGWINPASNAALPDRAASAFQSLDVESGPGISAQPFVAPAITNLPPRPWIFGRWLLRGTVAAVIAPGGAGKSALMVAVSVSLASGRDLLGKTVWGGPKRVWLWNLEDDGDELTRQMLACCTHHGLAERDYAGRLFVNDAASRLCTATKGRDGLSIDDVAVAALVAELRAHKVDVLVIDPFVSSHRAEENDNGQMDAVVKVWCMIAREAGCSIVLVHHSRKLGGQQVDAEAARGASAVGNAARSVLVLNRMDKSEATRLGIADEDRRSYIRVSNDKSNRAPAEHGDWYRLVSVRLDNGGPEGGDSVGVIERWTPPDEVGAIDDDTRARVQAEIAKGEWRAHPSAKDWVGHAIAKVIRAETNTPTGKRAVSVLFRDMLTKGQICTEQRLDASRHLRDFIVVGEQVSMTCDSPAW